MPLGSCTAPSLKPVRESIDEARALVAAGSGRPQPVVVSARAFLSCFDPGGHLDAPLEAADDWLAWARRHGPSELSVIAQRPAGRHS